MIFTFCIKVFPCTYHGFYFSLGEVVLNVLSVDVCTVWRIYCIPYVSVLLCCYIYPMTKKKKEPVL